MLMMREEDLKKVTGGTIDEFEELLKACASSNPALAEAAAASAHIPMANLLSAGLIEEWLESEFKIRAVIDLGVGGTGILAEHNRYVDKRNGKQLSQAEVLKRVMAL